MTSALQVANRSERVRAAFADQAAWCERLGSPLTAMVCRVLGDNLRSATEVERAILAWPGDPSPQHDSVPLRVCGALHRLARGGRIPALAEFYSGARPLDPVGLRAAIREAFAGFVPLFRDYLSRPPQTNEVGRSSAVMLGLSHIAAAHKLPLELYEIGASAGLNLVPDRQGYRFGTASWGDPAAALQLAPKWTGPPPPVSGELQVRARHGVDIAPIELRTSLARERLISYVWADQPERIARLAVAIEVAAAAGVVVDAGDAGAWLEARLGGEPVEGCTRVVFHTIVWSYLDTGTRLRATRAIEAAGAAATKKAPLAWLRYELEGETGATLRVKTWPGGEDRLLARGNPHATTLEALA
jgi:hypothetical protein